MRSVEVIVIGGGIAGLTTAWKLSRSQKDVLLIEAADQMGGHIRTLEKEKYRYETGPHSFMGSSEYVWKLTDELNLQNDVEEASPNGKYRYIFRDDSLMPLPMSAKSFIQTKLLRPSGKIRLSLEPLIPGGAKHDDTAWDYFLRRFGREAATFMMSPFISGVYAGDVHQLGARCAFPKFWNFERDSGSLIIGALKYMREKKKRLKKDNIPYRKGLFSYQGGLGRITDKLANQLSEQSETGVTLTSIEKQNGGYIVRGPGWTASARSIVIAAPPAETALLLDSLDPQSAGILRTIPMAPIAVVHWSHPAKMPPFPPGFGFLVPRIYDMGTLGTLFPSQLFKYRAPDNFSLFVSFFGGMTNPDGALQSDSVLADSLRREHDRFFDTKLTHIKILDVLRYPHAIPQLMVDHADKIDSVQSSLSAHPGIFLAGNYITGVGIEHAVMSGYRAAEQCLGYFPDPLAVGQS